MFTSFLREYLSSKSLQRFYHCLQDIEFKPSVDLVLKKEWKYPVKCTNKSFDQFEHMIETIIFLWQNIHK
jgi:hypothetical protein